MKRIAAAAAGTLALAACQDATEPSALNTPEAALVRGTNTASYSAFSNTRAALMTAAESTGAFGDEGSGDPHNEGFLKAGGL